MQAQLAVLWETAEEKLDHLKWTKASEVKGEVPEIWVNVRKKAHFSCIKSIIVFVCLLLQPGSTLSRWN